jgi:hypothetical protein
MYIQFTIKSDPLLTLHPTNSSGQLQPKIMDNGIFLDLKNTYNILDADLTKMECTYANSVEFSLKAVSVAFLWLKQCNIPKFKLIDRQGILEIRLLSDYFWQDVTNHEFKFLVYYWFAVHQTGTCKGAYVYTNDGAPILILTNPQEDLRETIEALRILKCRKLQSN